MSLANHLRLVPRPTYGTLSSVLLVLGCGWIMPHGHFFDSQVFRHFWIGYGLMGMGFALSWKIHRLTVAQFWAIALLCRILLLPMHPGDDIWRYIWEGLIQHAGFSPYHFAPNAPELLTYRPEWWSSINHPTVSAIYPPLTQWGFRLLTAIAPSVLLFKLAFVAADLAICYRLAKRYGHRRAIDYAWNPLVIYSFAGGGHYDSWFLLAVVSAWLSFDSKDQGFDIRSYGWSAFWIGISIAIKWISLPMLAFIGWKAMRQRRWLTILLIAVVGILPMVITALPFCDSMACPLVPTGSVFVSYGRSADLIPYLVSQIWEASRWENRLFAWPLSLWVGWLVLRSRSFGNFAEWYFFGLVILSPITHAWYFTWLVPFAVASHNWGTRFLSLSVSTYFALPYRQSLDIFTWMLRPMERVILWFPFIAGWLAHMRFNTQASARQSPHSQNSYPMPSSDS